MNRIILIGNGFDLTHGLKTSYKHFIDNFWQKKIEFIRENKSFNDPDNDVEFNSRISNPSIPFHRLSECFDYESLESFCLKHQTKISPINKFLYLLSKNCSLRNWVDIEKEYYSKLIEFIYPTHETTNHSIYSYKYEDIDDLNNEFEKIKNLFYEYLNKYIIIETIKPNVNILNRIVENYHYKDFTQSYKKTMLQDKLKYIKQIMNKEQANCENNENSIRSFFKYNDPSKPKEILKILDAQDSYCFFPDLFPNNFLLLNFNYTNTTSLYKKGIQKYKIDIDGSENIQLEEIHIHGELNNQRNVPIFGFGDEIDEDYSKIENLDDNKYLENIKSTRYHETDNYKKLLEYIDSDYFQIFIETVK